MRAVLDRFRDLLWRATYWRGAILMSELRKRWVVFRHPHATIRFAPHVYAGPGFSLHLPDRGATFEAGEGTEFRRGFRAEIAGDGTIRIGAGSVCTYDVLMQCSTTIDVGERCMFGQATMVVDGQHRFRDLDRPMLEQGYDFTPVTVGDDATITTKCTIMASVGTRAFVGANSVVSHPVAPYTVAVGAPARPVDYFGPPGDEPPGLTARDAGR